MMLQSCCSFESFQKPLLQDLENSQPNASNLNLKERQAEFSITRNVEHNLDLTPTHRRGLKGRTKKSTILDRQGKCFVGEGIDRPSTFKAWELSNFLVYSAEL
jgi:hypothetical protein